MTPTEGVRERQYLDYLRLIARHKWFLMSFVVLITTLAVGYSIFISTPLYQSNAELLQRRSGIDKALIGSDVFQESYQPERKMQTAAELVKSPDVETSVYNEMADRLNGRNPNSLVDVSVLRQADILRITATDPDPQLASDLANSYANNYINWRRTVDLEILESARKPIEAQLSSTPAVQQDSVSYKVLQDKLETLKILETIQNGDLEIVKPATPAEHPFSPKPMRFGAIAFLISLLLGIGVIFFKDQLDTRIRSSEEITSQIRKPVLSSIPKIPSSSNSQPITLSAPASSFSESFRLLKTNLNYIEPDQEIKSIMVTSPGSNEGKTTTISNLAITMARSGQRVIILEADLRRPMLSKYFNLDNTYGLSNAIAGTRSLRESMQLIDIESLAGVSSNNDMAHLSTIKPIYCATAGPIPPNPGELAASDKLAELIRQARDYADIVLVDAPPMGLVGDAASIASKVDGVLFVVRLAYTSKKSVNSLKSFIDTIPCNVMGLVVTNAGTLDSYGSYYGY